MKIETPWFLESQFSLSELLIVFNYYIIIIFNYYYALNSFSLLFPSFLLTTGTFIEQVTPAFHFAMAFNSI